MSPRARLRIHNSQSLHTPARDRPRSILSLRLTRDEFCSLTELKRDGRIPTATHERERAGIERAVHGEECPNGASRARAPFGGKLRWEKREGDGPTQQQCKIRKEGRITDAAGGKEGDLRFRFPIHPRAASAPHSVPFRSSSRLTSLIESANLVKTIHYFTIMIAAAPPPSPSKVTATDNFGSNKRPRGGSVVTTAAQIQ